MILGNRKLLQPGDVHVTELQFFLPTQSRCSCKRSLGSQEKLMSLKVNGQRSLSSLACADSAVGERTRGHASHGLTPCFKVINVPETLSNLRTDLCRASKESIPNQSMMADSIYPMRAMYALLAW